MGLRAGRFLDPKTDVVFKKVFGHHPGIVKSFLNSVLPLPSDRLIETVEYLTPEQTPVIPVLKNTIVDVKCTDQEGRIFLVEMQLQWSDSFTKRLTFGTSKAYINQLQKGEDYRSLKPVYGLGLINAVFEAKSPEWYHHYKTVNVKDSNKVLEGMELIFVELPKFVPTSWKEKKLGCLWMRYLRETDQWQDVPREFEEFPELVQAVELAQESGYSRGELDQYDKYWDAIRVESTIRGDAREEGERLGFQKGEQVGLEKARKEMAHLMKTQGYSDEQITKLTGYKPEGE